MTSAAGNRRRFIERGSPQELLALAMLLRDRVRERENPEEWNRILSLLERSVYMDAIGNAFTELLEDTTLLCDLDEEGYAGSSVAIALARDSFSVLDIGVSLKEISGEQLAYVLDVAERHGLQVREQQGWLRLSVNDPIDPMETADVPEEALAV
jgi:hypothetical protein